MRPRVRRGVRPPTTGPRGAVTEPMYRWKIQVADRSYRQGWHSEPGKDAYSKKDLGTRVISVIAPTERVAREKAVAAIGPLPDDRQDGDTYSHWTRFERTVTTVGDIEEVE